MSQSSSHTIQTQTTYNISQMVLTLRNQATIQKAKNQQQKSIHLANNMAHLQNNVITKNLVFQFPNHTITITDSIELSFLPKIKPEPIPLPQSPPLTINLQKNSQNKSQGKKLVLFKNRSKHSSETSARSNKKNIVKNVMGAFLNYFSNTLSQNQSATIENLKKLINKNRYNNKLIRKIIQRDELNFSFRKFLDEAALDWIRTSKLKDKEIHIEAINLYLKLCDKSERKRQGTQIVKNEGESIQQQEQQEQQYNMFEQGLNHDLQNQMSKFK